MLQETPKEAPMGAPTTHELFDLSSKVALVTGGARNLGLDMATAMAEAGADIAITSRKIEDARASAQRIAQDTGRRAVGLECDVADERQVEQLVDAVLKEFGKLDILINNAGNVMSTPANAPLEKRPTELWHNTINVNVHGVFYCSKHVVDKAMKPARQGIIINIGSTAGIVGKDRRVYQGTDMGGATIDYHAAKGAVINMTRDMAVYLAPDNIRVNCISPGGFFRNQPPAFVKAYSETIPMGRMGEDGKEMKGAAVFLASEASSYVTGHNLVVDGGLTAW